jgi:hypothetical protein
LGLAIRNRNKGVQNEFLNAGVFSEFMAHGHVELHNNIKIVTFIISASSDTRNK